MRPGGPLLPILKLKFLTSWTRESLLIQIPIFYSFSFFWLMQSVCFLFPF
jgi:hypothetical protein